jgi:hypothetical protein
MELQRAHDMLVPLVLEPVVFERVKLPIGFRAVIVRNLDVLCWALHHEHNTTFAENLALLDRLMRDHGIALKEWPEYFTGKEQPTE